MKQTLETMLQEAEKLINLAMIDFDFEPFSGLENKTIEICILPINQSFFLRFDSNQVSLKTLSDEKIVTKISAYPSDLIKILLSKNREFPQTVMIEGDIHHLQLLHRLLQTFSIDWEELLSTFIGDPLAYLVSQSAKRLGKWFKGSADTFKLNIEEYCIDEMNITPSAFELNAFNQSVDELRDRTERLIKQCEKQGITL